jgi:hypothetical protein
MVWIPTFEQKFRLNRPRAVQGSRLRSASLQQMFDNEIDWVTYKAEQQPSTRGTIAAREQLFMLSVFRYL